MIGERDWRGVKLKNWWEFQIIWLNAPKSINHELLGEAETASLFDGMTLEATWLGWEWCNLSYSSLEIWITSVEIVVEELDSSK